MATCILSTIDRFGPDLLISIPARGLLKGRNRGLKEDRTRSHANRVKNVLHYGRQPKKPKGGFEPFQKPFSALAIITSLTCMALTSF